MTLKLKKRLAAFTVMLLATLGIFAAVASPAQAVGSCTPSGSWTTAGSPAWGQVRWCYSYDAADHTLYHSIQIQDILTDGYSIHLEMGTRASGTDSWYGDFQYWPFGDGSCKSSGSVTTCSNTGYFGNGYGGPGTAGYQNILRIVKGAPGGCHCEYGWTWIWYYA